MKIIFSVFFPLFLFSEINYIPYRINHSLHFDRYGVGSYLSRKFLKHIKKNQIKTILEIGSRDAIDAIRLSEFFKAHVYAFECNPEAVAICKNNIGDNPNITFVEKAAWHETGIINFFPTKDTNLGASSCFPFVIEGKGTKYHRGLSQNQISVESIRIDEWMVSSGVEKVDLVCMDTQGATYKILKSFGDKLKDVKYIITEAEHEPLYQGEVLLPEIMQIMKEADFRLVAQKTNDVFGDYLFVNNRFQ